MMKDILTHNPFRTLGIYSGASAREIQRQITLLNRYAEIGRSAEIPVDFSFLGEINRDIETINDAARKIEQAKNKVIYALFWFHKGSDVDEMALEYLEKGDTEKAKEIWTKVVNAQSAASKNYSAYLNLSSLLIFEGFHEENSETLLEGIKLKGEIISSELFNDFMRVVGGEHIALNVDVVASMFFDEITQICKEQSFQLSYELLFDAFQTFPESVTEKLTKSFTEGAIQHVESEVAKSRTLRDDYPEKANQYGKKLFEATKSELAKLTSVFGKNSIKYSAIADDVAEELLQCGIDFFNKNFESTSIDPGDEALALSKKAKNIACSSATKDRIQENLKIIEDHVRRKPERNRLKGVISEINHINNQLGAFQNKDASTYNAHSLVISCKDQLSHIKEHLGTEDKLYLGLSSAVASNAQGMLIFVVNEEQKRIQQLQSRIGGYYLDSSTLDGLRSVIKKSWNITQEISRLDMDYKTREYVHKNREALKTICSNLDIPTSFTSGAAKAARNTGCLATLILLIATSLITTFILF